MCVCAGGEVSTSFPFILFILSKNLKTLMTMFFFLLVPRIEDRRLLRGHEVFFSALEIFSGIPYFFLKCHVFVVTLKVWDWA